MKKFNNSNKFITILITFLLLNNTSSASSKFGFGDLKMSNAVVENFITYVQGKNNKRPTLFAVSKDGLEYNYYYCPYGQKCGGGAEAILEECLVYSKKNANGEECSIFARSWTVKWDNGKSKNVKFKSKMSGTEIRAKLKEIGFID